MWCWISAPGKVPPGFVPRVMWGNPNLTALIQTNSGTVLCFYQPGKDSKMPLVTLQSSDLEKFIIEADVAKKSILVKNLLDDLPEDDEAIPIPLVNAAILRKVIMWMEQHKVNSIWQPDTLCLTNSKPTSGWSRPGWFWCRSKEACSQIWVFCMLPEIIWRNFILFIHFSKQITIKNFPFAV